MADLTDLFAEFPPTATAAQALADEIAYAELRFRLRRPALYAQCRWNYRIHTDSDFVSNEELK